MNGGDLMIEMVFFILLTHFSDCTEDPKYRSQVLYCLRIQFIESYLDLDIPTVKNKNINDGLVSQITSIKMLYYYFTMNDDISEMTEINLV